MRERRELERGEVNEQMSESQRLGVREEAEAWPADRELHSVRSRGRMRVWDTHSRGQGLAAEKLGWVSLGNGGM